MGLFSKPSKPQGQSLFSSNQNDEPIRTRFDEFHGTLADIKATPKTDKFAPDPRLESLNSRVFF